MKKVVKNLLDLHKVIEIRVKSLDEVVAAGNIQESLPAACAATSKALRDVQAALRMILREEKIKI